MDVCSVDLWGFLRPFQGGPWGHKHFYNNTKMLFLFLIALTSAMMVQKPWWVKTSSILAQLSSGTKLYESSSYCSPPLTHSKKVTSLRNVLDEAVTITNFIKSWHLSTWIFNILCEEMEVPIKNFCCISKYDGGLEEKCRAIFELSIFFIDTTFTWQTADTKFSYISLSIWQIFSRKWTKWNCRFKENN